MGKCYLRIVAMVNLKSAGSWWWLQSLGASRRLRLAEAVKSDELQKTRYVIVYISELISVVPYVMMFLIYTAESGILVSEQLTRSFTPRNPHFVASSEDFMLEMVLVRVCTCFNWCTLALLCQKCLRALAIMRSWISLVNLPTTGSSYSCDISNYLLYSHETCVYHSYVVRKSLLIFCNIFKLMCLCGD